MGKRPLMLVVLKGAYLFAADLCRLLRFGFDMDFVRASSYTGSTNIGHVHLIRWESPTATYDGKHIIVVEDIVDTGATQQVIRQSIRAACEPASMRICTLFDKPEGRQVRTVVPDYVGIKLTGKPFIVGYGLDYNELYRHLPDVYEVLS
jgi:hypoxanthine phosphoribosyltransferase